MRNILEQDYKSIIKQTVEELSEEHVPGYKGVRANAESFLNEAIDQIWDKLLDGIGAFRSDGEAARPEYIILSLYEKGIGKDKVRIKQNCFRVALRNAEYRIYRSASGYVESTCKINLGAAHKINCLTANEYAQALVDFDRILPEIGKETEKVLLRIIQEQKAAEIVEKTAEALIEDFAKLPLSHLDWHINDDGTISVKAIIVEVRQSQATVTIEELKDKLQEMKTELQTMPPVMEKNLEEGKTRRVTQSIFFDSLLDIS